MKKLALGFAITFVVTLAIAVLITLLWSILIDKTDAVIDWKTSFTLALILGLTIPIAQKMDKSAK